MDGRHFEYAAPKAANAQVYRLDDSVSDVYISFGSLIRTKTGTGGLMSIDAMGTLKDEWGHDQGRTESRTDRPSQAHGAPHRESSSQ